MECGSPEWVAYMEKSWKRFDKESSRYKEVNKELIEAQEALSNARAQKMDEEKIAQLQDEFDRIRELWGQERKVVDDAMFTYLYPPVVYSSRRSRHPQANSSTTDPADSKTCEGCHHAKPSIRHSYPKFVFHRPYHHTNYSITCIPNSYSYYVSIMFVLTVRSRDPRMGFEHLLQEKHNHDQTPDCTNECCREENAVS